MSEWIPVGRERPDSGNSRLKRRDFLFLTDDGEIVVGYTNWGQPGWEGYYCAFNDEFIEAEVTHWMPTPATAPRTREPDTAGEPGSHQ